MDGGSHSSGDHDDTSMLDPAEEAKKDPKTKLREKNKRAQKRWGFVIHMHGCIQEGSGGPMSNSNRMVCWVLRLCQPCIVSGAPSVISTSCFQADERRPYT